MSEISILKENIKGKLVMDANIHANNHYKYAVQKPPTDSQYIRYNSNTLSTSTQFFQISTQGNQMFLIRDFMAHARVLVVFTGTAPVGSVNLLPNDDISDYIALRFYPLQSCSSVVTLTINGTSTSFSADDIVDALHRYGIDRDELQQWASVGPCQHDHVASYGQSFGSNVSPLGNYFNSNSPQSRGAFTYEVISNTPTSASVIFEWDEPLMISPLLYSHHQAKGLVGLNADVSIQMTFNSLSRVVSVDNTGNGPIITNVGTSFVEPPYIMANWKTPPYLLPVAEAQLYPYQSYQSMTITPTNVPLAPGASLSVTTNTISLTYVPDKMLLFARQRKSDRRFDTADFYAALENINLNFNNKSGSLADARSADLYQISVVNGLKMTSYTDWHDYGGSVLLLDFGRDVPLPPELTPDMLGAYSIRLTATIRNVHPTDNINYDFYMIPINSGIWTIQNLTSVTQLGLVPYNSFSMEDIKYAMEAPIDDDFRQDFIEGGNFITTAKKLASSAFDKAKKGLAFAREHGEDISSAVEKALPYIKKYAPSAAKAVETAASVALPLLLGAGDYDESDVFEMLKDAGFSPMELRAAGLSGGGLTGGNNMYKRLSNNKKSVTRFY